MNEKINTIIDITHKLSMVVLVILLIGSMWKMNQLMVNLTNEIHKSYLSLDALKVLVDKSWWF